MLSLVKIVNFLVNLPQKRKTPNIKKSKSGVILSGYMVGDTRFELATSTV